MSKKIILFIFFFNIFKTMNQNEKEKTTEITKNIVILRASRKKLEDEFNASKKIEGNSTSTLEKLKPNSLDHTTFITFKKEDLNDE